MKSRFIFNIGLVMVRLEICACHNGSCYAVGAGPAEFYFIPFLTRELIATVQLLR